MFHGPEDSSFFKHPAAPALRPLRVGLLGIGTVGAGTYRVLRRNRAEIEGRAGRPIEVRMVAARNLARAAGIVGPEVQLVDDPTAVVNHPDIDVVVEVVGGTGLARDWVLQAIAQGKHVVTANKALLAVHGGEIFAAAQRQGVSVAFEGAVAVSIPIIKALREGLSANRIEWLAGIINGTTNFILSEMRDKGQTFDEALQQAQRLGYAEADPSFDVQGVDAAHKASLLAAIAFGTPVPFEQVHIEGITALQAQDIAWAEALGYRVKLLGVVKRRDQGMEVRVHPALVPEQHLLAHVNGSMNGIMVQGDACGQTLYYGAGAGSEQTASAVIADLIDVSRLLDGRAEQRVPHLGFRPEALRELPLLPISETRTRYYLRLPLADQPTALAEVSAVLEQAGIALQSLQKKPDPDQPGLQQLVLLTHETREADLRAAIDPLQGLASVRGPLTLLRVEHLG